MEKIDGRILAGFQMLGSRIVSLNIKNDSLSSDIISEGKKELEISHEIVSVDAQKDSHIGVIRLNVSIRIRHEKNRFALKLVLESGFSAAMELMDGETFEKMLLLNGIASLYGVARAHICSVSAQCFTDGALVLPMIDVTKYSKLLRKDGE